MRGYVLWAVLCFFQFIVLVNLFDVVRNLIWNSNVEKSAMFMQGLFLLVFSAVVTFVCLKLIKMNSEQWSLLTQTVFNFLRTHKVWLITASVCTVLSLVTMGFFGFLMISGFELIISSVASVKPLMGDFVWPLAISYSMFVPWVSFGIYLGFKKITNMSGWALSFPVAAVVLILFFLLHILTRMNKV